ncbi:MAG: sodium-dependent bicarbonate transport family permease, partial [Saprospiraceae bacterium]
VAVRSNLTIPAPLPKFFSLYLLFSIGFKGGVELHKSGIQPEVFASLLLALVLSMVVPVYSFFILRRRIDLQNAGAIAATYGSISAVTFITAMSFLGERGLNAGGHMVAAMALMEAPAIIIAVILVRIAAKVEGSSNGKNGSLRHLMREALTEGSVFLLLGSLLIGVTTNEAGAESVKPFSDQIFRGMLCLFLLDMGIVSAKRMGAIRSGGWFLTLFALLMPFVNATLGLGLSYLAGLEQGNAFLMTVLSASASYIAVPAAMRTALPDSNPGLYVTMSLAITFPLNIILGIPLYFQVIEWLWQ